MLVSREWLQFCADKTRAIIDDYKKYCERPDEKKRSVDDLAGC